MDEGTPRSDPDRREPGPRLGAYDDAQELIALGIVRRTIKGFAVVIAGLALGLGVFGYELGQTRQGLVSELQAERQRLSEQRETMSRDLEAERRRLDEQARQAERQIDELEGQIDYVRDFATTYLGSVTTSLRDVGAIHADARSAIERAREAGESARTRAEALQLLEDSLSAMMDRVAAFGDSLERRVDARMTPVERTLFHTWDLLLSDDEINVIDGAGIALRFDAEGQSINDLTVLEANGRNPVCGPLDLDRRESFVVRRPGVTYRITGRFVLDMPGNDEVGAIRIEELEGPTDEQPCVVR